MDFHLQWCLFDTEDNHFKDAMLLASLVMIERPLNVTKVTQCCLNNQTLEVLGCIFLQL